MAIGAQQEIEFDRSAGIAMAGAGMGTEPRARRKGQDQEGHVGLVDGRHGRSTSGPIVAANPIDQPPSTVWMRSR